MCVAMERERERETCTHTHAWGEARQDEVVKTSPHLSSLKCRENSYKTKCGV